MTSTLAPTPPMGWNSWNTFGLEINEDVVIETARAMVDTGLRDAGYEYVVIDDCWQARARDASDRLIADPDAFPSGMEKLGNVIHDLGMKFGIYSCVGTRTCANRPGSYGFERIDAQTFASWGVDYLKHDCCYKPVDIAARTLYMRMGQALRETGRPIVYSLCNWGSHDLENWAPHTGAHLWRMGPDIKDSWASIEPIAFEMQDRRELYAGPGRWNDPDMLVVGMQNRGHVADGGCSRAEYRTHLAMWCMLAAPLMIGCDVRSLDEYSRALLMNPRLIEINQDPLGVQAFRLGRDEARGEVWARPLRDGGVAVAMVNRHDTEKRIVNFAWESMGIEPSLRCRVVNAWNDRVEQTARSLTVSVGPHDCEVFIVTPST